jgi:hypothetical protein
MTARFTESVVESASLTWSEGLGWQPFGFRSADP